MKPLYVSGVGLWAPGYPDAAAFARRQSDPAASAPAATLFASGMRRRTSLITRAACEALTQAVKQASADPAKLPSVYTSAYGEIVTTLEMLQQMATEPEGLPSPTRFHNSVHNTAAGYASIASVNRAFSTSLAGGPRSVAMGMVESVALLAERGGELALVALDEPPPAPFAPASPYPALAVAFHLSAEPRPGSLARLTKLGRMNEEGPRQGGPPYSLEPFTGHPCAAALLLAEALVNRKAGSVPLSLSGSDDWAIEVEPL
ncbi:MAG: beta-ketoacyl synthase chain length factor [Deltaproteobacteria bacterium]|nr:beta-ketoacyl synthase chain length factor [Deltaproteobacteria bacterium]